MNAPVPVSVCNSTCNDKILTNVEQCEGASAGCVGCVITKGYICSFNSLTNVSDCQSMFGLVLEISVFCARLLCVIYLFIAVVAISSFCFLLLKF
jgi:hypothetical protein